MRLIRNSVFETNSSSTHSISIQSGDVKLYRTIVPNKDGVINIEPSDFGWEQAIYSDVETKLSYLLIYIRDWVKDDLEKEEFSSILSEVVCEHTGATSLNLVVRYDIGYIDHQSVECRDYHYLFDSKKELKDFIFNPESYLETDNDNH